MSYGSQGLGPGFFYMPQKNRVIVFIDGFNLYHSLDENPAFHRYKWLNLTSLASHFINQRELLQDLYYFTSICTWDQSKANRHRRYIKVLKDAGINVIYGAFKIKDKECRICHGIFKTPEEKITDVNIALYLFKLAYLDEYDTALLISGDTDLVTALKIIKDTFPMKRFGVVFPFNRSNAQLKNVADFYYNIKKMQIRSCRFDDTVRLTSGKILTCPSEWR